MNDPQIRAAYHRQELAPHHADPTSLVINELGIQHGRFRADIAVINGTMAGFEIKGKEDSLARLASQVEGYNSVFDFVTIIAERPHVQMIRSMVPGWWSIVLAAEVSSGEICFKTIRGTKTNPCVDDFAVSQLLWRSEAQDLLARTGVESSLLRKKRSVLYKLLVGELGSTELRRAVREQLRQRRSWPNPEQLSPGGDSYQPSAR